MPEIKEEIDLKQKALQFKEIFFIQPSVSTSKDLTNYTYKNPYKTLEKISTYKICKVIY